MSILQQVQNLIANRPISTPATTSVPTKSFDTRLIYCLSFLGVAYYILSPTLFRPSKEEMFTKRPDKYTTGLINLRNDCFANSSIQAYSSLPGLTDYLNKFIPAFNDFKKYCTDNEVNFDELKDADSSSNSNSNPKFKKIESKFDIPLHKSLARIMKKLQSTQLTSRTISVWTFLHDLEKIFNAKISRSQHDAHELTQLINETLENEFLKITKKFDILLEIDNNEALRLIEFPDFPLNGLILTQMQCLRCQGVSKPNFLQFLMLTLHAPETISTNLETLLNENESESIEEYQCLKCRINYILSSYKKASLSEHDSSIIEALKTLGSDPKFCINDDLPVEIEEYIKGYDNISKVTSTVLRKNLILKPPKIFGLHLSRSSFNGVNVVRNSCRVSFRDHLKLSIGKEYHEELKQLQAFAQKKYTTDSKVLTTDVDDMEDELVQREDIEIHDTEDNETEENETEETEDAEEDLQDDSDTESLESVSTVVKEQTPTVSLNKAPISSDQSDNLITHFKQFKFDENDVYKYRLKAMIRHQGSHSQGHYECYKRKPLFVKDKDGMIIKISPEVVDEALVETEDVPDNLDVTTKFRRASVVSKSSGSDVDTTKSTRALSSSSDRSDIIASLNEDNIPEPPGSFRRKFSNMMGRRPSIFQADPESVDIQEIIPSGATTPAEFNVTEVDVDYFNNDLREKVNAKLANNVPEEPVKLKKIPSLLKNPYWRISDSMVTEVTKAAVLCETTSVYMLYYERVEA